MSRRITIELDDEQAAGLDGLASKMGVSPEAASARLVEEELRRLAFPGVEFRDSSIGRLAYMMASSLAVWEVVMVAEWHNHDVQAAAEHLGWQSFRVEQALAYAKAYPAETYEISRQNREMTEVQIRAMLPPGALFSSDPVRF